MKTLLLTSAILMSVFGSNEDKTVYHCNSGSAKSYHYKKECRGLNACKHEIEEMTISEAKEMGLKLCGWEK